MSDDAIDQSLGHLRPITRRKVPLEGDWKRPPFTERSTANRRLAVVCEDPKVSELVVDRSTGEVLLGLPGDELQLVNRTLKQFVACALAFEEATRVAERAEEGGLDLPTIGSTLLGQLQQLDEAAVRDENQAWAVAAEELGYGF